MKWKVLGDRGGIGSEKVVLEREGNGKSMWASIEVRGHMVILKRCLHVNVYIHTYIQTNTHPRTKQ